MESTEGAADEASIDIISFQLGDQIYCVDIMAVREIRGWAPCTRMPRMPSHVLGVINLRGSVIPVVDVAVRIGLEPANPSERSAIIVIDQGATLFGLLVESVSDMIRIKQSDLQPVPDVLPESQRALAKAIVPMEPDMICFLDPEPLIGIELQGLAA